MAWQGHQVVKVVRVTQGAQGGHGDGRVLHVAVVKDPHAGADALNPGQALFLQRQIPKVLQYTTKLCKAEILLLVIKLINL